jgi:hypothetical protein
MVVEVRSDTMKLAMILILAGLLVEGWVVWKYGSWKKLKLPASTDATKGAWNLEVSEKGQILWQKIR